MMGLSYGASTDVGNVRDHNEDCYLANPSLGLWLVADGMGGHACGEVASDIVIRAIGESVGDGDELTDAIQKAHQAILELYVLAHIVSIGLILLLRNRKFVQTQISNYYQKINESYNSY